jgi:hypothetical protein
MKRELLLLLGLLALTGCTRIVKQKEIERVERFCSKNGGVFYVLPNGENHE